MKRKKQRFCRQDRIMNEKVKKKEKVAALKAKASLLCGKDFWYIRGAACGLPDIMLTDGPHGLRKQCADGDMIGIGKSEPAVAYPTGSLTACSWDVNLLYEEGVMLGKECLARGVSVLLGPAVNHMRSPLCGRNFEYFSEDPLLTGKLAAAYINGLQGQGVGACVKHFACNSQENFRMYSDSVVDERALREIYLKQFEIIVRKSQPFAMMTAYNLLNGEYCSQNKTLLTRIAREEWGFDGVFITDWGAMRDPVKSYQAGLDVEMPGTAYSETDIVNAVLEGKMEERKIDESAARVEKLIKKTNLNSCTFRAEEGLEFSQRLAEQSAVLLKNDGALPLSSDKKLAVIGLFAKKPRYQGAGSGKINPVFVDSVFEALCEKNISFEYADGYDENCETNEELLCAAEQAAQKCDVALLFLGLSESEESEGEDRKKLALSAAQNELVRRVANVNRNVIAVLQCGSSVTMPWLSAVKSVLWTGLAGSRNGVACVNLLFGKANPCGKLAQTFPLSEKDIPCAFDYGKHEEYAEYRESIFTGYRYYDTAGKDPLFAFGHGLSYTNFEYGNISLESDKFGCGSELRFSVCIANVGAFDGREIVQVYISQKCPLVYKAEQELKAFCKLFIKAGESAVAEFSLDRSAFEHFDLVEKKWQVESGVYEIRIGSSSKNIRCRAEISVQGDDFEPCDMRSAAPCYYDLRHLTFCRSQFLAISGCKIPSARKKLPYTALSPFKDLSQTALGRIVLRFAKKACEKHSDPASARMQMRVMEEMPLDGMTMGTKMSRENTKGFADILNGKIFRGVIRMLRKPKIRFPRKKR